MRKVYLHSLLLSERRARGVHFHSIFSAISVAVLLCIRSPDVTQWNPGLFGTLTKQHSQTIDPPDFVALHPGYDGLLKSMRAARLLAF